MLVRLGLSFGAHLLGGLAFGALAVCAARAASSNCDISACHADSQGAAEHDDSEPNARRANS